MDPTSSFQPTESEDSLFGGISDLLFEEIAMEEDDALFEGISDDFFDQVPAAPATAISAHRGPSFIDLPPEIRNMVYDLVFVSPEFIGTKGTTNSSFFKDAVKWRNLNFAMSCRQIHDESANVFYAKNGFEFYYIRPFKAFMESIGIEGRRLITKLNFNFLKGSPFLVLRYIRSCRNIQHLNISLRVIKPYCKGWWLYPFKNAKEFLFTDFDKLELGEASGVGEARDSDAMSACKVAPREKGALFKALTNAKHENIYAQNG